MAASTTLATLDGSNVCRQFSYKPMTPKKRKSLVETSGNIVLRVSPTLVVGDMTIPFTIVGGTKADWDFFRGKFNQPTNPDYVFTGYWGDVCTVKFIDLDQPTVSARYYEFGGLFQVVSVSSYADSDQC